MSSKIISLVKDVLKDGARAAKFAVLLALPEASKGTPAISEKMTSVLCKATSFPGKNIDPVNFQYKGRTIPLPGQVKYTQTWELTFYLEENHASRLYFLDWMQALNNENESYYSPNTGSSNSHPSGQTGAIRSEVTGANNFINVIKDFKVYQLDFDMKKKTAVYNLFNCYPVSVSDVQVSSESVGQMLEYTVTFSYSHFTIQTSSEAIDISTAGAN